ncbi:MAG: RHS repeat-associated core domain-containing protein [Phycisphaerales bacterium]|nr:MAG: RHS repeat-associated core domain-containing protein [Phycisphaerales bacterium]
MRWLCCGSHYVGVGPGGDCIALCYLRNRSGASTPAAYRDLILTDGSDTNEFIYDRLNRLTKADRGVLDSNRDVIRSDLAEEFKMDLLGNLTSGAGGLRMNEATSATLTQDANATNEITTVTWQQRSNAPWNADDEFSSLSSDLWTQDKGTWASSGNKAKVTGLTSDEAILLTVPEFDVASYVVDVWFPTESSDKKAGVVFGHDGDDDYYAVVLDRSAGAFALHKITNGSWGSALDSDSMTISDETTYTVEIKRQQRRVEAYVDDESIVYDSSTVLSSGYSGFFSDKTDVTFDNFNLGQIHSRDAYSRGTVGIKGEALPGLGDEGDPPFGWQPTFEGEAVVEHFFDDDYMVQLDFMSNVGHGDIVVRRIDRNNGYRLRLDGSGNVELYRLENGKATELDTGTYTPPSLPGTVPVKIKVSSSSIKAWVDGSLEIDATDSTHAAGGVAMASDTAVYANLKIGYDNNSDDDIDDTGDDIVVDDDLSGDSVTASHDHAGNMIDDGYFRYVYDAWNRLVKVQSSKDSGAVTFQTAEFDGKGQRIKKVVTNSGSQDGTVVYLYEGQKIIETRDGSGNLYQQFIHGTQYVDELVMMRVKGKGDLYVHQDANWNVIGLTDLGGHLVERYVLASYGEVTVYQETGYGDYDEDYDVMGDPPSTSDPDYTAFTGACAGSGPTGACRILDLDFDGDVDTTDRDDYFMSLPHGVMLHPGRIATAVHQPFGHQGLLWEPELRQYQNRFRQYDPARRRFMQRDPLALRSSAPAGGFHDGMSLYAYLRGNPNSARDPMGLATSDETGAYGTRSQRGPCRNGCGGGRVGGGGGTPQSEPCAVMGTEACAKSYAEFIGLHETEEACNDRAMTRCTALGCDCWVCDKCPDRYGRYWWYYSLAVCELRGRHHPPCPPGQFCMGCEMEQTFDPECGAVKVCGCACAWVA